MKGQNCQCEGARPEQSPAGWVFRPSSFPRTRSREARDRLDPGSESGVTNNRQSRVPRGAETWQSSRILSLIPPRHKQFEQDFWQQPYLQALRSLGFNLWTGLPRGNGLSRMRHAAQRCAIQRGTVLPAPVAIEDPRCLLSEYSGRGGHSVQE
jgi:hypothetical protein